ncbi:Ribokinase-like protein [Jimgerdemannia flammicorona]|uniref:Ribokinase-like protein n=1 Tax=Jimgerdemannia flammicorona TaxID=994334 RepID=A0A433DKG7_9FUNG|nr:Ribokinase-like protein [Jimgerdemannia flammicorona]
MEACKLISVRRSNRHSLSTPPPSAVSKGSPVTNNILVVGAIYQDTILHVNGFPDEDEKRRAEKIDVRRGGNAGNTVEVLAQFPRITTWLMSSLGNKKVSSSLISDLEIHGVKTSTCVFRKKAVNPSSYIIHNKQNGSRTIISYNDTDDITIDEFKKKIEYASITKTISFADTSATFNWIHFEGRNVENVAKMIDWIDAKASGEGWRGSLTISVEFEKPDREGLDSLLHKVDILFGIEYGARANDILLEDLKSMARPLVILFLPGGRPLLLQNFCTETRVRSSLAIAFCTWGSSGASLFTLTTKEIVHASALPVHQVIDGVGAGDTFIAGIIYTLCRSFTPLNALKFASELASRKVAQNGFHGLAENMLKVWDAAVGSNSNGGAAFSGSSAIAAAQANAGDMRLRMELASNVSVGAVGGRNGNNLCGGGDGRLIERERSKSASSLSKLQPASLETEFHLPATQTSSLTTNSL